MDGCPVHAWPSDQHGTITRQMNYARVTAAPPPKQKKEPTPPPKKKNEQQKNQKKKKENPHSRIGEGPNRTIPP